MKYRSALGLCSVALLFGQAALAQEPTPPRPDTTRPPPADTAQQPPIGVRVRLGPDTLPIELPPIRRLAERESYLRAQEYIARARATAFQQSMRAVLEAAWGQLAAETFATERGAVGFAQEPPRRVPTVGERAAGVLEDYTDLVIQLNSRMEVRGEQTRNARCAPGLPFDPIANCRSGFEPLFDFQASLLAGGIVADRVQVDVDYDSQREFESSNNISLAYSGKGSEAIERFEIGNVSFQPPRSQFLTVGIPSNNTGVQAITRIGPMRLRTIFAQQKGHVVTGRTFTIGDRTLKAVDRAIEDYQFEPRRFFFTIDPQLLPGFPNIDLLDHAQLAQLAATLPDTLRPSRIFLYRLLIGAQPPNPSGPQFRIIGDPLSRRGPVYEYLREGIDYYADPSLLWIALVRPLALNNERLVVAYTVRINGRDTVHVTTGGTPDLEFDPDREQFANLLWDPQVQLGHPVFDREIRSIYRIGGPDIVRTSVSMKVVTGPNEDQERPAAGPAETYLQLFGLAQPTSSSSFDVENRLWPRPSDANLQVSFGGGASRTLRDQFLVFPSLRPFARTGLTQGNAANDTIYTTPAEFFGGPRRPQTVYYIRTRYQTEGGGEGGSLMLGSVQLRPNSERISVDGVQLVRGLDYTVDYELGRVSFARPDTLFFRPRQVTVHYEENPLFADTPTSILGGTAEFTLDRGEIAVTALSQTQRTTFNRPPLGFEPASAMVAGVTGTFGFDAEPLRQLVSRLPWGETSIPARVNVTGEFAMSRPKLNAAGQAYLESFESEGGIPIPLDDRFWYYGSQPALGAHLPGLYGAGVFDLERAATLAWQSSGLDAAGRILTYSIHQIDPQTELFGAGVTGPEPLLWLTLYPLPIRGLLDEATRGYRWRASQVPPGRRWRSVRTVLAPSGADLTRAENLEFWVQMPVAAGARARNPVLVFDFGEISENSIAFSPDTATVRRTPAGAIDTLFTGLRLVGLDELDSERDPFSRAFNVAVNDIGLPGDRAPSLTVVIDTGGGPATARMEEDVPICAAGFRVVYMVGDSRANCTVANNRLDEEDIDGDNVLNLTTAERDREQWRRFVVDLATMPFTRRGQCSAPPGTLHRATVDSVCWVLYRVPFRVPNDSLGVPLLRRMRALRITMLSSGAVADHEFQQVAIARLRLTGSPWLKRDDRVLRGLAGTAPGNGFVIAGVIGTQDRNVPGRVNYESPPGVVDEPDSKTAAFAPTRVQINERSLRLLAGGMEPLERAEAFYRFPEGEKNFLGYREMRLWARGIGPGWGDAGELHFYVRIGRDPNNFYLFRTTLNGGTARAAWLPEIQVDFNRLIALRAQLQTAFLGNAPRNTCAGVDSLLLAASAIPPGAGQPYAACADGYIAYSVDPIASAPNLAAVQELSVGMLRLPGQPGAQPVAPGDTLELWVNDIRLAGVVNETGYAAQIGATIIASDFADLRVSYTRRDPHFRQLAQQPSYLAASGLDISTGFRLEKLFPRSLALSIPVTFNYTSTAEDPLYLSQSDIEADVVDALRKPRSSATSYTIQVRRAHPVGGSMLEAVLDNLTLSSTYTAARARTEYQHGDASRFTLGMDFNVSRALFPDASRWMPADLHFTSVFTRARDERVAFLFPRMSGTTGGRRVEGATRTWRNGTVLSFRPWTGVGARLDLASVRDLRNYSGFGPPTGDPEAPGFELDMGAERERTVQSSLNIAPPLNFWVRPRLDYSSSYHMLRDPNALFLGLAPDTVDDLRMPVPRRLANNQTFTAAAAVDLAGGLGAVGIAPLSRMLTGVLRPLDVSVNRNVLSLFDATEVAAPLRYQFAWGSAADFRNVKGSAATAAGVNNQLTVVQELRLPLGASLTGRYHQITLRNWTRRFDNTHAVADGSQVSFPDVALRWTGRPSGFGEVWSNLSLTARYVETRQEFGMPVVAGGFLDDRGSLSTTSYPVTLAATWSAIPGLSTNFTVARTFRDEQRPGLETHSSGIDFSFDVAKPFTLPESWDLQTPLRTRVSYQSGESSNFVVNPLALGNLSRLTESGRRALMFTADTDVAENLSSSFVVSRVVSFDRNLNRQFTQTVLSAVLHMRFFGGELR